MKSDRLFVGLDIGTTKVCVVVGEIMSTDTVRDDLLSAGHHSAVRGPVNRLEIIGVGTAPSKGMKKGVVTNIEHIVGSIREAVEEAEDMAGVDIKSVHAGITGGHIGSLTSHGVIAVKDKEIGERDVENVIEAAKAVAIPFDREMLHVIPLGFTINGQNGITDPRGMAGVRLETNVQIITGAATTVQNMIRSCEKAGLEVIDVIFQPIASANAVLTEDEKDLGAAVIDIGGGTTDLAIYHESNICHSTVFGIGGNNFTNDLAIGLRIPTDEAEIIKKKYGCAMISLLGDDEEVEIGQLNGKVIKKIPRQYMIEILQPRAEELFNLLRDEITGKGFQKNMNSGVVLTGGGVLMEGIDVMAENILELPVRIGTPEGIGSVTDVINNPAYATAVGLMSFRLEEALREMVSHDSNRLAGKMRNWIGSIFKS